MPDWKDKDMEQLFRNAASQQEFEYKDAAWQQMEQMLDARKRRRRFFFWWWRGLGLLFFVAIIALGMHFFRGPGNEQPAAVAEQDVSDKAASHLPKEEKSSVGGSETTGNAPFPQNTNNLQAAPDEPALKEESTGSQFGVSAKDRATGVAGHSQADKSTGTLSPELNSGAKVPMENDRNTNAVSEKVRLSGVLIPFLSPRPLQIEPQIPRLNPNPAEQTADQNKRGSFYLALVAGGALTSVGPEDFSQLNSKFGLGLEYRINKGLGLSTGINYMRLDYRAGEGEYTPPKGFWTRKIAPQSTIGHCDILELPLNLNYHSELESGAGISLSAGFSSLLIFRQRYYYQYDLADDDLIRKWKSNELKSYWLSLGTVSVGYEVPLTAKTRLDIVPYMQFPVSGIGHGNVKLYSVGITARLGWKL